jgi:hypothetical protein
MLAWVDDRHGRATIGSRVINNQIGCQPALFFFPFTTKAELM